VKSLAGQSVVVVHGATNTGLAIAATLASAGAGVTVTDRDGSVATAAADRLGRDGLSVTGVQLDVTDPDGHEQLAHDVVAATGRLDVWVNNVAIAPRGAAEAISSQDWQAGIDEGLSGAFYGAQAAGRQMLSHGSGVVLNVIALEGEHPVEGCVVSSAVAGGGAALTRALAIEWAASGVRVVASGERGGCSLQANAAPPGGATRRDRPGRAVPGQQRGIVHHRRDPACRRRLAGLPVVLGGLHVRGR
jgi:NAD(P)-dependent dehydrogenase (short-subunit alcohol dehydrogenase family)